MFFMPVDEYEVMSCISSLTTKFSNGPDGLNTYVLKQVAQSVVKPLTVVINKSLSSGTMPDSLKIAKVVPIYKKDDTELMCNYRPVSILSPLSKIFEKIVLKQLDKFASINNLFFYKPVWFQKWSLYLTCCS